MSTSIHSRSLAQSWTQGSRPKLLADLSSTGGDPNSECPATFSASVPTLRRPDVLVADDHCVDPRHAFALFSIWDIAPALATDGAKATDLASGARFDVRLMHAFQAVLDGMDALMAKPRDDQDFWQCLRRCCPWAVLR